ncbi:hypothetical protein HHE94_19255 [Pseudoalteromonas arctica]|uniref:Antitoxin Xre/MbcA/ParS-like toxin-binding domain-containing protein n=1 Tax=Pseudoalteromonas arctica TaxID=394751 RepID=A0AAP6Y6C1_9GAMM|nr:hypothetical protein [Pseudoalteromonas arctica]NMP04845.1 hypothetical protein [Pseudoalteromonas arctica]
MVYTTDNYFINIISNGQLISSSNPLAEIDVIHFGIDIKSTEQLMSVLGWDIQNFAQAIGTNVKTLGLYKKESRRLSITLSENAIELAKIASICMAYFKSKEYWNIWLDNPNSQFDNKAPRAFIGLIKGRELIYKTVQSLNLNKP